MRCPNCQNQNPEGARFCNACGSPLAAGQPQSGERRLVSILFSDVVGSTAMAERVDPEVWTEIMDGAIRFMIDQVTRFDGTVSRLMGDGLLALFGAPVSHENDAERAVLAALGIRDSAATYAERLLTRYGFEFAVRSGINTGLSVLTRVGDETKAEYTAMGDAANLAARLQSLAPPQGILIGPETHELVRFRFETKGRGAETIRGKSGPVSTYEVVGPVAGRSQSRGGRRASGAPFVGRQGELGRLRAAVESGLQGRASLVFVVGEAGLGKSRLIEELRAALPADPLWVEGRAISYARDSPLHPWQELLTASLGLPDGSPQAALRERLATLHSGAADADGKRPAWLGLLAVVMGLADEADQQPAPVSDPDQAAKALLLAVSSHLRTLSRTQPLVLVLDDLHWADEASIRLLDGLAGTLADEPIVILCPLRPDRHVPSWHLLVRVQNSLLESDRVEGYSARLVQVRLQPLVGDQALELMSELLGSRRLPEETSTTILAKAEGNPLFLEEVIRALSDAGQTAEDGEQRSIGRRFGAITVPDTLAGVLSARIDRLQPRAREVAQTAAVIGRYFPSRLLRAVMAEPRAASGSPDIDPELQTLTAEDLINHLEQEGEIDYRFKHELTKDAAYERLLHRRRRELHGRVADEILTLHSDRRSEVAKDLGHHYRLGERWVEAARWSLAAARTAKLMYSLPEALKLAEAALEAVDLAAQKEGSERRADAGRDPASERAQEVASERSYDPSGGAAKLISLEAEVLSELVSLGLTLRLHEDPELRGRQVELAQRAVDVARRLGDEKMLVTSLVNLGNIHVLSGFPETGFGPLLQAHDLSLALGEDNLFLLPFWVATEIMLDDAPLRAAEQLDKVVELARKVGNKDIEAHALGTKTVALARLGRFRESLDLGVEALAAAEASGSIIKRADVALMVGASLLDMGNSDQGLEHIERGTDLALSVKGMQCACTGLYLLGEGQIAGKRLPEGVGNLQLSLDHALDVGYESLLHNLRASLAGAEFLAGDTKAIEAIEREIDNAESFRDGFGAARARLLLGQALLTLGRPAHAEEHVRRAISWFEERDMKPYALRGQMLLRECLAARSAKSAELGGAGDAGDADDHGVSEVSERIESLKREIEWPGADAGPAAGS